MADHKCIDCPESRFCDRYDENPPFESCLEKIRGNPLNEELMLFGKFMGWCLGVTPSKSFEPIRRYLSEIEPWSKIEYWPKIWGNISKNSDIKKKYMSNVISLINKDASQVSKFDVHTAKPKINWEALIMVLKGL